jgi:putative tricarboxylic transport membrane protein
MGRRHADLTSGAILLVCGLGLCFRAATLGLGHAGDPGPGFTIFLAAALLALFSVVLMLSSLLPHPGETREQQETVRWGKIGLTLLSLIVYALILTKLGFVLSTFLLVVALLKGLEGKKWSVAVACGAAVALGMYAVFELWLQARLPRGPWGF